MCLDDECARALSRRGFLGAAAERFAFLGVLPRMLHRRSASPPFMAEALADPSVIHGPATFSGRDGATIRAHVARPNSAGRFPSILINHGNAGMPEDIRAAAAFVARWGYLALGLDSDSREGDGSGALNRPIEEYRSDTFARQQLDDNDAARAFIATHRSVMPGRPAMLGFCGGGYLAFRYAVERSDPGPVVAFYSPLAFPSNRTSPRDPRPDLLDFLGKVNVPFQVHFGTRDPLIPADAIGRFKAIVEREGLDGDVHTYEGADHAFCDYTRPELYDEAAAKTSLERAQQFLRSHQ